MNSLVGLQSLHVSVACSYLDGKCTQMAPFHRYKGQ
jgi:hypothetical protein